MKNKDLISFSFEGPSYRCFPAHYSTGKMVLQLDSDGSGFKTHAMFLAEDCGEKWVHRDHGYQLSPRQAAKWKSEYTEWLAKKGRL